MRVSTLIALLIGPSLLSCNLEVDTTDPQASKSPEDAKRDSLYLSDYKAGTIPESIFLVDKAWAEYIRKNEIKDGQVIKRRSDRIQICLIISNLDSNKVKEIDYLSSWSMESADGYFGRSRGVYVLRLREQLLPDSLTVSLKIKNEKDRDSELRFTLHKLN